MLERLWAGWRNQYVRSLDNAAGVEEREEGVPRVEGQTLFESILATEGRDAELGIVHRGELVSVILNIYPYGSGHLLVLPNRGVERLTELTADEVTALWATVNTAVGVCEAEYDCPGINVGLNQGKAAGAGIPEHLHVHVLPRWHGDTNFMTSLAETRVLPESLATTHERLTARWP
ncbi:MAG: HIT domain-containing protein [Actinomycetota bacterium]